MVDKERVIKGLECCAEWMGKDDIDACNSCPYHKNFNYDDHGCLVEVNNDAIFLLKEQEPKPIAITTNAYGTKFYHCPKCGKNFYEPWELYKDHCYNCGQELIWDGRSGEGY